MILIDPAKDFLARAAHHAKELKQKEINSVESDLILLEEQIISADETVLPQETLKAFQEKIAEIRNTIRQKKTGLY